MAASSSTFFRDTLALAAAALAAYGVHLLLAQRRGGTEAIVAGVVAAILLPSASQRHMVLTYGLGMIATFSGLFILFRFLHADDAPGSVANTDHFVARVFVTAITAGAAIALRRRMHLHRAQPNG